MGASQGLCKHVYIRNLEVELSCLITK